jgi:transcription antitermination factor NusG
VVRQWSDRKKKLEVPLFNSYIFVKDLESSIPEILKTSGISWNIKHNGKPAVLRDKEMETIKRFITSGLLLEALSVDNLEVGDKVTVIDGPLRGAEGIFAASRKDQKFTVLLESIGQAIRVSLDKSLLKKVTF